MSEKRIVILNTRDVNVREALEKYLEKYGIRVCDTFCYRDCAVTVYYGDPEDPQPRYHHSDTVDLNRNGNTITHFYDALHITEVEIASIPGAKKQIEVKEFTMEELNEMMRRDKGYEVKIKE